MSITFNHICELLEGVEKVSIGKPRSSLQRESNKTAERISTWFKDHRAALNHRDTNGGAVLSIIFPHRRKDRVYGLKPTLLSRKLSRLLHFQHAQRALFDGWSSGTHGDLGAYTEKAMKPWNGTLRKKSPISIAKVNLLLVQLAARHRCSDSTAQIQRDWHFSTDSELQRILVRLESWEAKWLVRLILREYPTIELDENFVLKEYHFLLPDLLAFQNDFDAAFDTLRGELSRYPPNPDRLPEKAMRIEAASQLRAVIGIKVGRPTFYKAWSFKNCFQLMGNRSWAAEVKYDGEYCEIHVNLKQRLNDIIIFSKNGKDATNDRKALLSSIRNALRIGQPDCKFKQRCIVLGELVLYSDKENKILPFSKIRKHISRSGSFIGTGQDSLPHEWEHLMIVFFDVLVLDQEQILRKDLQSRRTILRDLVQYVPGRSMRSEWTPIDFKTEGGITDLKQAFARSLAKRQEGLVLKPLNAPYFPLLTEVGHTQGGYFIKLKRDYLCDMGTSRDLGDFAVIGASHDAQVAAKSDVKPLHWTHFFLGCLTNPAAVRRTAAKPCFKIVGSLSLDKCIPKADLRYLNIRGRLRETALDGNGTTCNFDVEKARGHGARMSVAFKEPFVVEILGGGYEKLQNESFEMLRHPRLKRIHHDRSWEDAISMQDLERMAERKWAVPDANELDGHSKDVALMVKRYARELNYSQASSVESETSQETTQRTSPPSVRRTASATPVIQETPQSNNTQGTWTTASSTQYSSSTQGVGARASRSLAFLVREDTSERLAGPPTPPSTLTPGLGPPQHSGALPPVSPGNEPSKTKKRGFQQGAVITPPPTKRRKTKAPLADAASNENLQ